MEQHGPDTPETLVERWQKLAAGRRNTAMRELMARAEQALADRTPEQVEDDRQWGEALHKSFEDIHGYPIAEFGVDRLHRRGSDHMPEEKRPHRPIYSDRYIDGIVHGTNRQRLASEDLEAYAEPHELDHDGGPVEWDDQEAEL